MSFVLYEPAGDRIVSVTINRPDRSNALGPEVIADIVSAVERASADPGVSVVILKGAGRGFSGGHDMQPGGAIAKTRGDVMADRSRLVSITRSWLRIWDADVAVIAQVHGYCLAGALELTMLCDLVVAADNARFAMPAMRGTSGSPPSMAYPFVLGLRRTKEFLWLQEEWSGSEAADMGLINRAVPADELEGTVLAMAQRIARLPPENVPLTKAALHRGMDMMNFRPVVQIGAEFDTIGHLTASATRWRERVHELGLKAAIAERDAGW